MYTFQAINLLELNEKSQNDFRPLLDNPEKIFGIPLKEGECLLSIVAFKDEKPIGLAFGYAYPSIGQGFIRSLFVLDSADYEEVGSKLLSLLSEEFQRKKIQLVTWQFFSWSPNIEILKKIQQKQGWAPAVPIVERYSFESATFAPPWYLAEGPSLPKDYKIFQWRFLTAKQEQEIRRLTKPHSTLQDISPFDDPNPVELINSIGLKKGSHVVGWMINHRMDKDTIRYSALYIHGELRGLGPAVRLLKESIKIQKEAQVKYAYTEINLKRSPKYWLNFVRKRLAPYSTGKNYTFLTYLNFNEEN